MKHFLKKLAVPLLASAPVSALATSILGYGIPIFMIHRIKTEGSNSGISPQYLRRCLNYLTKNGYNFVSLEEIILSLQNKISLPQKAVAFTMDDGFLEQGEVAAPIFLEFDCPLTFFVITGMLDKTLWPWDSQISWVIDNTQKNHITINFEDEVLNISLHDSDSRSKAREEIRNIIKEMDSDLIPELTRLIAKAADVQIPEVAPSAFQHLDWEMARKLESRGVRFAPHSKTHRILSKLSKKSAQKEITESWETICRELSNPLKVFCYPTGRALDFGPRETNILKKENFMGAISTLPGYIELASHTEDQIFHLPRLELPENMTDFIQCCSWIEHAKSAN